MVARFAAVGAVVVAVVLLIVVLAGGGTEHRYSLVFENAGQLVKGDDVQVGGRRVGQIRTIELTDDNMARIGITVREPIAPLHEGTQAIIRATSLSGVANRYVALTPGPQNKPKLDDKAELGRDGTTTIVDLDQLINTFDEPTRADLQEVIQGFSTQLDGQGKRANRAAEYFNPFLSTSRKLVSTLTEDEAALTSLLVNASKVSTALADRSGDLTSFVSNANDTASAIAAEDASFDRALSVLPSTLRRGNSTFVNLRAALADLNDLTDASKPATRDLAPFLRRLRPFVNEARPTVRDLRTAISRPGADNDLVDATLRFPRLSDVATPALRNSAQSLRRSRKNIAFFRPYTPDFVGWLRNFGQSTAFYDANGHYARVAPLASAFSFEDNSAGGILRAIAANDRLNALSKGNTQRCPGAATQVARDGSNANTDALLPEGGCDPSQTPSGP